MSISNATLDFSDPGSFTRSIVLTGSGANTIQADSGVFKLSGVISGSGGLTKAGLGTLAISNPGNSYSGGTNDCRRDVAASSGHGREQRVGLDDRRGGRAGPQRL